MARDNKVKIQLVKNPKITKLVNQRDANILIRLGRARLMPDAAALAPAKPAYIPDEYDGLSYAELRKAVNERELETASFRKDDLLAALRGQYLNRAMTSE